MRAEDLFEAIGELDEDLIARSQRRVKEHSGLQKRRKRAEIYRIAIVVISTAAAVFLLLMVRDLIGTRGAQNTKSGYLLSNEQEAEEASEDAVMAEEAMASEEAPEESEVPAPGEASEADKGSEAGQVSAADQASEPEENKEAGGLLTAGETDKTQETRSTDDAEKTDAGAESPGSADETENASDDVAASIPPESKKAAVDLMGDYKDDYVYLEYISAEDAANGGETTVPEYTKEGEEILSRALANGKAVPTMVANTGEPAYYVYLTKENGKVDTITFYELSYVSMTKFPGVVMKISQADYEDVMTLFR